jgi:hypothetical protein
VAGIANGHNPMHKGKKMEPGTLDLEGLPEPIARGLQVVAEMARKILRQPKQAGETAPELPRWRLGVIGALSRDEIYDDYGGRC